MCEEVHIKVYVAVRKAGTHRQKTSRNTGKDSSGTAPKEDCRGLVQKESTLCTELYNALVFSTKTPKIPISLCWARNYSMHKNQKSAKGKTHGKCFILFK